MSLLVLRVDASPKLSLATEQARLPLIHSIEVQNVGEKALEDLIIEARLDPDIGAVWREELSALPPGATRRVVQPRLALSVEALRALPETTLGHLRVRAHAGDLEAGATLPLTLLPAAHWPGTAAPLDLLASFLTPSAPSLDPLLREASTRLGEATGRQALDGYQSGRRRHAMEQLQAVWLALGARDLRYLSPPPSFTRHGQKVRLPAELLAAGAGACLDLSLLLGAALERCGLHPVIVLTADHAFAGVHLDPSPYQDGVHESIIALRKAVDLGELVLVETTLLTSGGALSEAREQARRALDAPEDFLAFVDVHGARVDGVTPLALVAPPPVPLDAQPQAGPPRPWEAQRVTEREELPSGTPAKGRIEEWKERLLDLSLRNRLLNFRLGKKSVELCIPDLGRAEDALARGTALPIVARPLRRPGSEPVDLPARALLHAERGQVLADHTPADLAKRMLELFRLGRSSLLETGATTTTLILGMLRWYDAKTPEVARRSPLIMLPVTIDRGGGARPYAVRLAASADPELNLTLLTLLRRDHQLSHPGLDPEVLPEDDEGIDVPLLLRRFRELVKSKDEWEVEEVAVLASLTFKKALMVRDLTANTAALLQNPVVRHIFNGAGQPFALAAPLPTERGLETLPAESILTVLPADPSQRAAVQAVADGSSLVLQGPPGTGKSQTITNLIADTLARGRTVLFVAEKKAAIEVVHRRLRLSGLGPFALELHSDSASKKQAIDQIREAVQVQRETEPADWKLVARELAGLRDQLNAYATALQAPTGWGPTVFQALSGLIGRRTVPAADLGPLVLDAATVRAQDGAVERAIRVLARVGPPGQSPWAGARIDRFGPDTAASLTRALDGAQAALDRAAIMPPGVSPQLSPAGPQADRQRQAELLAALAVAGTVPSGLLHGAPLDDLRAEVEGWQQTASERQATWSQLAPTWSEGVLTDHAERADLLARFRRWAGVFLLGWLFLWSARRRVAAWAAEGLPSSRSVRAALEHAQATVELDQTLSAVDGRARTVLGRLWHGVDTDWDQVWAAFSLAGRLRSSLAGADEVSRAEAGALLRDRADALHPGQPLAEGLLATAEANRGLDHSLRVLRDAIKLPEGFFAPHDRSALRSWVQDAQRSGPARLRDWCGWQAERAGLVRQGLAPLAAALERGEFAPDALAEVLQRARLHQSWSAACRTHASLADFQGVRHDALISRFRTVDRQWAALTQRLVRARVSARMPDARAPGQMALIRRQLELKRRHLPLRKLFREVPTALRALKPCVLMSPLAVARYLAPEGEPFDLVIFDEASQIPPWDAIGAIARGRQCIIVGDSRQLPPTAFFSRGDDDEDGDVVDEDTLVSMESILEEAVGSGLHQLRLQWHYRSRHESLITFSNRTYYDNALLTFPAADHAGPSLGVRLVPVPEGAYDRGGSRTNRAEAERIVAWLRAWSGRPADSRGTVGVVTFNMAQQRLIEDLLDQHGADEPALATALGHGDEPVFVKNLENVQGDERDTILFSICYGPDPDGTVAMNFGPLNKKGGERRLNVAITRARQQLRVFSTLRHDQIALHRTRALGVQHLRSFLDFARRGVVALDEEAPADDQTGTASLFSQDVAHALEARGWQVAAQLGCSGYRIDLAVEHPDQAGRFILAVECDGPGYHATATARARDRQRQEVLEGLGWRFHRIWSTDWWQSPEGELRELDAALASAMAAERECAQARHEHSEHSEHSEQEASGTDPVTARHDDPPGPTAPTPARAADLLGVGPSPSATPASAPATADPPLPAPVRARIAAFCLPEPSSLGGIQPVGLDEWAPAARLLGALVTAAGPLPEGMAWRWLVDHVDGAGRMGARRKARCESITALAAEQGLLERSGTVLWPPDMRTQWTGWRRRGARTADEIPVEEVRNVAAAVMREALGIRRAELVREVARRLDFQRRGRRVDAVIDAGIALMVAEGIAGVHGEDLRLNR